MRVRLGEWNVREQSEPLPYEDFNIDHKEVHPDYKPATFQNDIALVRLTKKVNYKEHILPGMEMRLKFHNLCNWPQITKKKKYLEKPPDKINDITTDQYKKGATRVYPTSMVSNFL